MVSLHSRKARQLSSKHRASRRATRNCSGAVDQESDTDKGYRARFEFTAPTGGIDLMAGPYAIETRKMTGAGGKPIQLRTYFHSQIADLRPYTWIQSRISFRFMSPG